MSYWINPEPFASCPRAVRDLLLAAPLSPTANIDGVISDHDLPAPFPTSRPVELAAIVRSLAGGAPTRSADANHSLLA